MSHRRAGARARAAAAARAGALVAATLIAGCHAAAPGGATGPARDARAPSPATGGTAPAAADPPAATTTLPAAAAMRRRTPPASDAAAAAAPGAARGAATRAPALSPFDAEAFVGVVLFEDDATTDAPARVAAAGASWARTRALWTLVEPAPGRYDWSVTDWLFGDATDVGLRNLAAVYASPPWAAPTACGPLGPLGAARWAPLWRALVERYDGDGVDDAPNGARVAAWQVGNEVDFSAAAGGASGEGDYGSCLGDDPAAYAALYAAARAAAVAADPGASVGFGPVAWDRFTAASAPAGWSAPPGPTVYDFTARALDALASLPDAAPPDAPARPLVDFVALHHYDDNARAWDGPEGRDLVARAARFRATQLVRPGRFDLRAVPLVLSETGLPAAPSDDWTRRDEALQAAYVGQIMVRARAAGAALAAWFTARDEHMGDCAPPHWDWLAFGLMRSDDRAAALAERCPGADWAVGPGDVYALDAGPATPRPALAALATVAGALRGRRVVGPLRAAPDVEAYRLRDAAGAELVAAWAVTGGRLGARGDAPASATWAVDAAALGGWTGRVAVTGALGERVVRGAPGATAVTLTLGSAPVYVTVAP